MSGSALLLSAIAAIIVFLLYMVVMQIFIKNETSQVRLRRLAMPFSSKSSEAELIDGEDAPASTSSVVGGRQELEMSSLATTLDMLMRLIGIDTDGFRKKNLLYFYRAGAHSADAPIYYLFFKRIGFILFLAFALWITSRAGSGMHRILFFTVAGITAFLGIMGPDTLIRNMREKREIVLQRSFPDALDLLLVCVESGLALDGALSRVCKELGRAHPTITVELNRTRLELTMLNDRVQALNNLAERTGMLSFRSLVSSLLQSERFGTSLTDTLRVLSEDFRNTRLIQAEEKAGRLPALMTIPLMVLLLPALFIIIMGPAIINILKTVATM